MTSSLESTPQQSSPSSRESLRHSENWAKRSSIDTPEAGACAPSCSAHKSADQPPRTRSDRHRSPGGPTRPRPPIARDRDDVCDLCGGSPFLSNFLLVTLKLSLQVLLLLFQPILDLL